MWNNAIEKVVVKNAFLVSYKHSPYIVYFDNFCILNNFNFLVGQILPKNSLSVFAKGVKLVAFQDNQSLHIIAF